MAVKPITNKQVVASSNINRAKEVSTRDKTIRGNRETTIIPGKDFYLIQFFLIQLMEES